MKPAHSQLTAAFIILTALVVICNLAQMTSGLRLASFDDECILKGALDESTRLTNRLNDFSIGRFYADTRFFIVEALIRIESDIFHNVARFGFFSTAVIAMAWFFWQWTRDIHMTLLIPVLTTAYLPVTVGYQPLLSSPTLWLGWAGIWTMAALVLRPESPLSRAGIPFSFAIALCATEGNSPFLLLPLCLHLAAFGRRQIRRAVRATVLCALVLGIYGAISITLRIYAKASEIYEGAKISLSPGDAVFALSVYTGSGLPGLDSWIRRPAADGGSLFLSPSAWIEQTMARATSSDYLAAALVGAALLLVLRNSRTVHFGTSSRAEAGVFAVLIISAFVPNLLIALTKKYQVWAHQRMWPYYYTYMSYLLLTVVAAGMICLLQRQAKTKAPRTSSALALSSSLGAAILALGTFASNRTSTEMLRERPFSHHTYYKVTRKAN